MITIKEDTTLVGISELRTHIEEILAKSKNHKVVIGKRNKPVAVIVGVERYQQMEDTLDLLEDFALGLLAKERDAKSKPSDYISYEEALKRIKKSK